MDDVLTEVLARLSPRERDVLRLRFGLDDGRQRTIEDVAELYGVTKERVRQIEARALRKLRRPRGYVHFEEGNTVFKEIPREKLSNILNKFAAEERKILKLRWGFTDERCHTAEEIAQTLGISVSTIREIEAKALQLL